MATMFSSALVPDSTVATNIRGWATWVEQVVTTIGGWTVTSDTGQTPPGSLPVGTTQFQKLGYRIYQMHDDFTDDQPIFMRIDFGVGFFSTPPSNIGATPGMWFSFGGGTNGAGTLTGVYWTGAGWNANAPTIYTNNHPSQGPLTYTTRNYASGDNSRFILGMFIVDFQNVAGYYGTDQICFSLERTRDASGNYTGDGLLITYTDPQLYGGGGITPSLNSSKYLICNRPGGNHPPLEQGLSYVYVGRSPAYSFDGSVPCAMTSHFRGVAQQPGTNYTIIGVNDLSQEGQMQVVYYQENRIYQQLRNLLAARATAGPSGSVLPLNDGGSRVCMRYD